MASEPSVPANEKPFEEELQFLRGLIARPRSVGAIAPSSPALSRAVAAQVDPERAGPILELGPGTGVITKELLGRGVAPERLTLIEYDPAFVKLLGERFPGVRVINGDGFEFERSIGNHAEEDYAAIVSGMPLLNFPLAKRRALIETALKRLRRGAPFVQFSYGFQPPVSAPAGAAVRLAAFVWKNLPPARVWVYRRR
jgi:phosphatidylethanolamine/phosphatidyl-N-methylethanolamine N-methyltransferase